jgi:hypothetical protein
MAFVLAAGCPLQRGQTGNKREPPFSQEKKKGKKKERGKP